MEDRPMWSQIKLSYDYAEIDKAFKVTIKIYSPEELRKFGDISLKFKYNGCVFIDGSNVDFIKHGNSMYEILLNSAPEPCTEFNDEIIISGELPFDQFRIYITAKDIYFSEHSPCDSIIIYKLR